MVWILGGETQKNQGDWYQAAEYLDAIDPFDRLLTNHSSHLRGAFDDSAVFDFDMMPQGNRQWETASSAIAKAIKTLSTSPAKPYVSGESCYEQHMQGNFADLQRQQFWGLMLSGAAGHTYGAAGIWHMGTREEHGNWGGWDFQPYDFTTWREGMHFAGSTQLGRSKALLENTRGSDSSRTRSGSGKTIRRLVLKGTPNSWGMAGSPPGFRARSFSSTSPTAGITLGMVSA